MPEDRAVANMLILRYIENIRSHAKRVGLILLLSCSFILPGCSKTVEIVDARLIDQESEEKKVFIALSEEDIDFLKEKKLDLYGLFYNCNEPDDWIAAPAYINKTDSSFPKKNLYFKVSDLSPQRAALIERGTCLRLKQTGYTFIRLSSNEFTIR